MSLHALSSSLIRSLGKCDTGLSTGMERMQCPFALLEEVLKNDKFPNTGNMLIDRKMEFIEQRLDNKQNVAGEYLSNTKMSIKNVYSDVLKLLLAGVDTVNVHL